MVAHRGPPPPQGDAEDVVQLLHESLLDAFTTDTGEVDYSRKGGMSLAKQVPAASLHARARTARFSLITVHSRVCWCGR